MADPFAGLSADALSSKPPSKLAPIPPAPVSTSQPTQNEKLKSEVEKQEKLLTNQLANRMRNMKLEAQRLAQAKRELDSMGFDHRKDIDVLRAKIETNSRDLSYANNILRQKIEEHKAAALEVERLNTNKELMIEHLRTIIYDNEQQKKKKLNEIMARLDSGSVPTSPKIAATGTNTTTTKKSPPSVTRTSSWTGF